MALKTACSYGSLLYKQRQVLKQDLRLTLNAAECCRDLKKILPTLTTATERAMRPMF